MIGRQCAFETHYCFCGSFGMLRYAPQLGGGEGKQRLGASSQQRSSLEGSSLDRQVGSLAERASRLRRTTNSASPPSIAQDLFGTFRACSAKLAGPCAVSCSVHTA
jgi:hypothetical protein